MKERDEGQNFNPSPSNVERRTSNERAPRVPPSNLDRRTSRQGRDSAFTVLELFVATAILIIITGMLFSIFNQASNAWNNGAATIERQSNARIALEMLNRELASAYVSSNSALNSTIKFFGSPNAVYFVATVPPSSVNCTNGFGEFAYVYKSTTTNLLRYFTQAGGNFRADTPFLFTNDFNSMSGDSIADNVLRLSFAYYATNDPTGSSTWDSTSAVSNQKGQIPSVIEATMTMIDSKHALHMPAAGPAYDTYTARYARTQSMVIHLQNAPTP